MNFQAPPLTRVNKTIIITTIALFVLHSLGRALGAFSLIPWLSVSSSSWMSLYTVFTYPLLETQLLSVMFNGLVMWFLGSELERQWGEKIYIKFLFACSVVTGLLFFLISSFLLKGTALGSGSLMGLAGLSYALCVAYATLYPDRQFMMMFAFPVKAKWFCVIMVGVELYMALFSGNPAAFGHLFSMGMGYLLIRFQTMSLVAAWFNQKPSGGGASKRAKNASHLKLVKPEDDKPKYWH